MKVVTVGGFGTIQYFIDGRLVSEGDLSKLIDLASEGHSHRYSRYVGLQKVIDYCDCGYEREVPYNEINEDVTKA